MFLARAKINRRRREAALLLTDPQRLHAFTMSCFGEEDPSRPLWRVDSGQHVDTLYVVSANRPDLTHLVEQAGWPEAHPAEVRDYAPLLDRLESGVSVSYRLTANPSFRHPGTKKRVGHVTVTQQQDWAARRLTQAGLDVSKPVVVDRDMLRFRRDQKDRLVTISRATFAGQATITDPAALRAALVTGIGPAKAYGCGLLTIG